MVEDLVSLISKGWKNRAILKDTDLSAGQEGVKRHAEGYNHPSIQYTGLAGNRQMLALNISYERIKVSIKD